jgi:S-adenosylmethionine decarboxylase proenzyme
MQGLHLTADAHDCAADAALLRDRDALRTLALAAVQEAGLTPVGELFHAFPGGGGVTGVVLLAESHVALHTWPELRAVTLDVYVCNFGADNSARAEALLTSLESVFAAGRSERRRVHRGAPAC